MLMFSLSILLVLHGGHDALHDGLLDFPGDSQFVLYDVKDSAVHDLILAVVLD